MNDEVKIELDTGYFKYPYLVVTFDGIDIRNHFKDEYLNTIILDAIVDASDDKDLYDFTAFIFSAVNNSVKRRYKGQSLMLLCVEAAEEDYKRAIRVGR